MKYKILAFAILAVILYSCAAKSTAPTAEVKPIPAPSPEAAPTVSVATVMTPELAEGKSLYENNCAHCHKLYDRKDFTADEWKPIIHRMQKQAGIDDLTTNKIYNYLAMN